MDNFSERLTELISGSEKNIKSDLLGEAIGVSGQTVRAWCSGSQQISLKNLLKLADYFNCSLDFIVGRTDIFLDYTPRECPPFYQRFRNVLNEKGKTRYRVNKETKIKDSYFTKWSKGTDPHVFSLIEMANYLDITIDYLVGRDR